MGNVGKMIQLWRNSIVRRQEQRTDRTYEYTKKKLRLNEEGRNLISALVSKRKEIESTHAYFKPRFNLKPKNKRGMFLTMVFKVYLKLSLPISIQQVNEFTLTGTSWFEALMSIWEILTSIDRHTVILAWYP